MADPPVQPDAQDATGPPPGAAQVTDHRRAGRWSWRRWVVGVVVGVAYLVSYRLTDVDLGRLVAGLSTMGGWAAKAWPPTAREFPVILQRTGETVAIALIGTTLAAVIALILCVPAARNLTPHWLPRLPARLALNTLRGVDSFVFALLFVAAVGLGRASAMRRFARRRGCLR